MAVLSSSSVALLVSLAISILAPALLMYYLVIIKSPPPPLGLLRRRGGNSNNKRLPLPPSPRGLPLLGHLHLLGSLPNRSLRSIAATHGPVVLLRLGRVPVVVVSSVAGAEEVMRTRDLAFASRPASAIADRLLYSGRDVAFAPYGEYWRQARRVCVLHLLSARRVQSFRRVREQEARRLVDRVWSSIGKPVELGALIMAYANAVVSRAAFGDESARGLFGEDRERIRQVFTDFQTLLATEPIGEFLPWLGWVDTASGTERKIKRTFQALDALLDKVLDDHRRRHRPPTQEQDDVDDHHRDFVDVLLDVSKNEKEYGIRLETNEIKAIILDMFAAGTDTTTTVMEWTMAELVRHPRAMRRLQADIRAVGAVTEGHLGNLAYLKAVIKETLRLHAPIPLLVPRTPPADAEVLGHRVPAGTRVVVNAWAIGRDPATWGHDAEEFRPERFLLRRGSNDGVDVDYRGQSFELIPFGAGRRGCPGIAFAEQTIELALASLLYHFDWKPATSAAALDMTEKNGLAVHIKNGLPLRAKPWIVPDGRPETTTCAP